MFKALLGYLFVLMTIAAIPAANAATVVLHSGQTITGDIIQQTELRVVIDVDGTPTTYFLGEIASIDGKAIEMPQEKAMETALTQVKTPPAHVPYFHDEQDSLINFMNKRNPGVAASSPAVSPSPAPVSSPQVQSPAPAGAVDRSVVATPDGGLIVVTSDKITRYDRNFKVIQEVAIATPAPAPQEAVAPVQETPPAPAPPAAASPAVIPPPAAVPPAVAPPAAPAVSQDPKTLKDFFGSFFSSPKKS